jgi:hypothetical protein
MDKRMREMIRQIETLGLRVERVTQQGKHPKLHVTNGVRTVKVTVPVSCSDWRAGRKRVAFLRREFALDWARVSPA